MKLEKQVTSLKLSKKLKELGVKQESLFSWLKTPKEWRLVASSPELEVRSFYVGKELVSAFTATELGEKLPVIWGELLLGNDGNSLIRIYKNMGDDMLVNWTVIYDTQGRTPFVKKGEKVKKGLFHQEDGENLAKVLAKMLIYLKENKLI